MEFEIESDESIEARLAHYKKSVLFSIVFLGEIIDPLLFLVIPRSPKTRSQNIATFKPFPS